MHRMSVIAAAILALILSASPGTAEKATAPTRAELLDAARSIMEAAHFCALVTVDAAGHPHARTMDPFSPEPDMVVWLATNPKSEKVSQIAKNPRVALYYFDSEAMRYVSIEGTARVVDDAEKKRARWKKEWETFYPDREKGYVLIRVTPLRMEIVSAKEGIASDPVTWAPAAVEFGNR